MQIQGLVGQPSAQSVPAGQTPTIRSGQLGDVIVSELHGRFYETAYRGSLYSTFINALTLTTTHVSPLAASTGTPIIGIKNPIGSPKNLSLVRIQQTTTSGTPAGPLIWNIISSSHLITAASNAIAYNNGTLTQTGSATVIWNNTAITGSLQGVAFRNAGGPAAIAAGAGIYTYTEMYDGSLIIPPGTMIALACTGAGTSHVISVFAEWEEIPI